MPPGRPKLLAFFRGFFQEVKSIVMQISFVMLLFLDQIAGGGGNCLREGLPPCGRKPDCFTSDFSLSLERSLRNQV